MSTASLTHVNFSHPHHPPHPLLYRLLSDSAISADGDTAVPLPSLIIDKRLPILKPLIVEWAFDSWKELNKRTEMLLKGWSRTGLDTIFDTERQESAITRLLLAGIKLGEHDDNVEENGGV